MQTFKLEITYCCHKNGGIWRIAAQSRKSCLGTPNRRESEKLLDKEKMSPVNNFTHEGRCNPKKILMNFGLVCDINDVISFANFGFD
jgi:hypothetical protein